MSAVGDLLKGHLAPASPDPPLPAGTPAGVLVPILEREGAPPALLFTLRSQEVRDHKGEISFPGGVRHEEDPDLLTTAIRETEEELGIRPESLDVLGALPPVLTVVTDYVILPVVAILRDGTDLDPSPVEIAEVLELGIHDLVRVEEEVTLETRQAWFAYTVDRHTVWGATGRIVHAFLEALKASGWPRRTGEGG